MQRETLEIWERLGIGERVARRGVQWDVGRTYFRDRELFSVHLPGRRRPLPAVREHQPERSRGDAAVACASCRRSTCAGAAPDRAQQDGEAVSLTCDTADGPSTITVAYAIGTDGAHSSVRHLLGMGFPGHSHEDLFLICDIRATLPFPRERRFFFDPPWNPGRQVLVHPQPDDVWRIDWQVHPGPMSRPSAPRRPGSAHPPGGRRHDAVRAGLGHRLPLPPAAGAALPRRPGAAGRRCRTPDEPLRRTRPELGAADAENLAWKLALVLGGRAPEALLDSYDAERAAAVENLAVTDASMRFMVPTDRCGAPPATPSCAAAFASPPCAGWSTPGGCRSRSRTKPRRWWRRRMTTSACRRTGRWPRCTLHAARPERNVARLRDLIGPEFLVLLVCRTTPERAAAMAIRAAGLAWPRHAASPCSARTGRCAASASCGTTPGSWFAPTAPPAAGMADPSRWAPGRQPAAGRPRRRWTSCRRCRPWRSRKNAGGARARRARAASARASAAIGLPDRAHG